ncbi:MAG: AbiH family protein, partial [Clostridiaceae bacterium]
FSIINFNYTHVFDHGIDVLGRNGVAINGKTPPNCDTIGEVYHIHGKFSHEMVMGVDGDDQIANQDFARNAGIRQRIIKPEINEALNHGLVMDCKKTISKSQIIVVFGMSIGKTDRTWWKSVGEWLKRSKDHQLIIFIHIEGQDTRLAGSINVTERGTQNRLLNFTALTDVEKENVRHQITVVLNCELFGTRLFRLE